MRTATQALEREHQVIGKVLAVMAQLVEQLEARHLIQADLLREIVQFIRVFADQCHHGKEESYLFPLLERKGVPAIGCPLGTLRGEHEKERQLTGAFSSACSGYIANSDKGRLRLIETIRSLLVFYPAHIWKEEYLLFPMAEKMISAADHELLLEQFQYAESDIGVDIRVAYEAMAEDLHWKVTRLEQRSAA